MLIVLMIYVLLDLSTMDNGGALMSSCLMFLFLPIEGVWLRFFLAEKYKFKDNC